MRKANPFLKISQSVCVLGVLAALLLAPAAQAGPGFFITTYGGRYMGMGGTHIALGGSILDLQGNPAMLLELRRARFEMGGPMIFGKLVYKDDFNSFDGVNSSLSFKNEIEPTTFAIIPYLGYAAPSGDNMAWGISFYAQAGGGVDINDITSILPVEGEPGVDAPIPLRFIRTVQNQFLGAFFFKLTPGFAIQSGDLRFGLGLDVVYGQQNSKQTFFDETTGEEVLKLEYDSDQLVTFGGKVGVSYAVSEELTIAYAYMAKNVFNFDGEFTETDYGEISVAKVKNRFTLPDRHTFGFSYTSGPFTLAADGNLVRYAAFFKTRRLELSEPLLPGGATVSKTPLNYKDQFYATIGAEYKPKNVALRAGWNYGKSPIRERTVNVQENLIAEHHAQVGIGFDKGNVNYNFALEVALPTKYSGEGRTDWANQRFFGPSDRYSVTLSQTLLYFSVGYNF